MSSHDRNASADVDAILQRHLHVKSFAKMDQAHQSQGHQSQGHQGHGHGDHSQHQQDQHAECESPKIKRKIGNEELTSHRLIEKRRRDRMNSCLADLSRLIPSSYIKKGRGRVEKTEIVQMAIKYIRQLQQGGGGGGGGGDSRSQKESVRYDASIQTPDTVLDQDQLNKELFMMGYNECFEETIQFLVERESMDPGRLVLHLRSHFDEVVVKKVGKLTSSKAPRRRFGVTSDSDYTSLQSDTSSDWSQTSKATSMMTTTSSTSGLTSFSSCDDMDEILCRSKDQRSDKRSFKTTDDLRSQYKFKADMRDRFRFHQQDAMFWQPSGGNDDDDRLNNKQEWSNWAPAAAGWPIKRRKYSLPFEEVRDTRAMPPPPASSSSELESSDTMAEAIWPKLAGRAGFATSGMQLQQLTPDIIECDSGPHHHHHHQQQLQQRRSSVDRDSNPGQGQASSSSSSSAHSHNSHQAQDLPSSNLFCSLKHKSVPIFALHPLGSYYIPLVVNYGLLAPFVTFVEDPKMPDGLTLHPVTISVNFCTKPVIQMPPLTAISTSAPKSTSAEKSSNSSYNGDDEKSKNSSQQFDSRSRTNRSEHRCSI